MGNPLRLPAVPDQALLDQYRKVLAGWPVPHATLRLPTAAGETFVLACGGEEAPPLVLLHGAQANAAAWMVEAAAWSRHFRVYVLDLPGEPGLSAPQRPALDAYAPWLDDVMDGLRLDRAAFLGVSFGGWVALDYAVRRPQRVKRLALLCPGGIGRQKAFLLKALPLLLLGRWGAARVRRMILGPAPAQVPEAARPVMALMERIMASVRPRTGPIPVLGDRALQGLRMPLQVTVGARDPLIDSRETARRLARWAPHAEVRVLPDGHHVLPGQQDAVLRFLLQEMAEVV